MANREIEYRFTIEAYSPDTIPMVRLGEYMAEFGRLLSNTSSVHFRGIEPGSTVLKAGVEFEAEPKVRRRLHEIKRSEAPTEAIESVTRLNDMLRYDNAIGRILAATAINDHVYTEELFLPGKEIPVAEQIGPFWEPASIKAMLFRVGGRDETAHASLIDSARRVWNGELTREQATRMAADGLYRWFNVTGKARWIRTEEHAWRLLDLHIDDFNVLPVDSLAKDIEHLRSIKGNKWGDFDPLEETRKDDDGVH
ncbi:MAG: hypothetical protein ACRD8U_04320 [Pyrinomonadaceae bacterium]